MMEMEVKVKIKVENNQEKAFCNKIKEYFQEKVVSELGICEDIQDYVMESLEYDDETGFSDVGVKIEAEWNHDYM